MLSVFQTVFRVTSILVLVGAGLFFVRLIAVTYRTDGPFYPLRIDPDNPVRSAALLLAGLGARGVALLLRAGHGLLETLYEASADLGEWYVTRRGLGVDDSESRSLRK